MGVDRPRPQATRRVIAAAAVTLIAALGPTVLVAAQPAAAAQPVPAVEPAAAVDDDAPGTGVLSPETGAYFGSIIDWSADSAADQAERLGRPSAVYENAVPLPMTRQASAHLEQFAQQVTDIGALPVITVRPTVDLDSLDDEVADDFVSDLSQVLASPDSPVYLRFAPDMNSSWVDWGFDPDGYRTAFRTLADAVHAELPGAAMVWSPTWGGSYPFGLPADLPADRIAALDTTRDGILDGADDPYGPYYPGDAVTDWVGLQLYHDDSSSGPVNTVPAVGELTARLGASDADESEGSRPSDGFYSRFVEETGKPMMLETAAVFSPAGDDTDDLAIKQAWWRQVFHVVDDGSYPALDVVLWRDTEATRAGLGEAVIDWSVTLKTTTQGAFREDLEASTLQTAPILAVQGGQVAAADGSGSVTTDEGGQDGQSGLRGWAAWACVAASLVMTVTLMILAFRGVAGARLAYDGPPGRDLRIDMLRGLAIVFVVVNHVGIVSVFQGLTQEAVGVVSGAELFVLLSGVVLGMVYRPKVVSGGIGEVVIRATGRAWKLYAVSVVVVLLVFLVGLIPFVDASAVTTFVDQGLGASGSAASGRVYDLYSGADALLGYPVSPHIITDIALLRLGPWQFNVMGLYVVLLLVTPLVLWALSRRSWAIVIAVSTGLYGIGVVLRPRIVPSQFEDSFPLLVWQILFVYGLVAGYYRREIVAWFSTRIGRVALSAVILLALAFAIFSAGNPYLASPFDVRLALLPDNVYRSIYDVYFGRTYLAIGRLVDVFLVVIALYALLTAYWRPLYRLLGWFLVPLGQASLYIFILHVFVVLIVSNIPALLRGDVLLDSVAYVVILGLLWTMVKTRFLYGVVPR